MVQKIPEYSSSLRNFAQGWKNTNTCFVEIIEHSEHERTWTPLSFQTFKLIKMEESEFAAEAEYDNTEKNTLTLTLIWKLP